MRYFTVARVGLGTDAAPFKPNVPAGTAWVGTSDAAGYLVATEVALPAPAVELDDTALRTTCSLRGFSYPDVISWRLG